MNDKNPSNLSDEESQNLERKKKKKKKKLKGTFKREAVPKVDLPSSDPEIDTILKKVRTMDNEIQQRMNRVAELCGMSPREVTEFIENPENFPPEQWSRMQQKKQELEEKLYAGIGVKYHKRILQKKKKKIQKGRIGKTLGHRKGWIQM